MFRFQNFGLIKEMNVLRKIIKHEWRMLLGDATLWIVVGLLTLAVGYAIFNGSQRVSRYNAGAAELNQQIENRIARYQRRVGLMEQQLAAGASGPIHKDEFVWGPQKPAFILAWVRINVILPAAPLQALAVGNSELYTNAFSTPVWREASPSADQTTNPVKSFTGHLDLAFVVIYLFPLFILALSFNLVAYEKDNGTLGLLLSQPLGLTTLITGKVAVRALLVFGCTILLIVTGVLLSGINLKHEGILIGLCLWLLAVVLYGCFWFGLATLVNAFGKSAAMNALILLGCWIAFIILIPAALNFAAETLYPLPTRAEFINADREARQRIMTNPPAPEEKAAKEAAFFKRYYEDHPEFKPATEPVGEDRYPFLLAAKGEELERQMQPVQNRFTEQKQNQQAFVRTFSFVSPAVLMQSVLYNIAGTGDARYENFLEQATQYYQVSKDFFRPQIFRGVLFTPSDFDKIPRFQYEEESFDVAANRTILPLLALMILTLILGIGGLYKYKSFSQEREDGTLLLTLSQPVRLRDIVLGKTSARLLVALTLVIGLTLIGLAVSGVDLAASEVIAGLVLWLFLVVGYTLFWFALAVGVNSRGLSSATNAVALVSLWLLFVVIVPSLLSIAVTSIYPVPSRFDFIEQVRRQG